MFLNLNTVVELNPFLGRKNKNYNVENVIVNKSIEMKKNHFCVFKKS